jgi:tetratricopeptide (TPR) repeat protein
MKKRRKQSKQKKEQQIQSIGADKPVKELPFLGWVVAGLVVVLFLFFLKPSKSQEQEQSSGLKLQMPQIPEKISDHAVAAAIQKAMDVVRENTGSDEAWGALGLTFLVHEYREEAQQAFSQAFNLRKGSANWRYYEGICYFPDDLQKGISLLAEASALIETSGTPEEHLAVRRRLANVYLENGQFDHAEKLFSLILAQSADNESALLGLGQIRNQQGRFNEAKVFLERCGQHPCTRKRAQQSLSVTLRSLGDLERAESVRIAADALPADMDWMDPFIAKASNYRVGLEVMLEDFRLMMAQGRFQEAVSLGDRLLKEYPQSPHGYLIKSDFMMRDGRAEEAKTYLREALKLDDQNFLAWTQLGLVLGNEQNLEEAIDCFDKAIALSPSAGDAHFNRGFALMSMGRNDEALVSFETAILHQPSMPEAYIAAGQVCEEQLDYAKAKEFLNKAREVSPGDLRVKAALERISVRDLQGKGKEGNYPDDPGAEKNNVK